VVGQVDGELGSLLTQPPSIDVGESVTCRDHGS
jgi:hypothetical protein